MHQLKVSVVRTLRFAAGLAALAALHPTVATAQTADASGDLDDDVVITGSRIQNPGMSSPTPLTVLSVDQIKQVAPSSVDDVMNQLPAFRPSSGPNQLQRNTGSIFTAQSLANLRGLGAQRTLMLVDGQRPVPTNQTGTSSTSLVPVEMIQRIEVVTGGASAAYGSDAVSGVMNFVLKQRIDGVQGSVYGGQSEEGDNEEFGVSLATGFTAFDDKLKVVVGGDYNNKGMGNIYSRKWSAVEPGNSGNPISFGATRPAGTAAFGWANGVQYATQTPGGVINTARSPTGVATTLMNQLNFATDGSTSRLVRGPVFGNLMINSTSNSIATPLAQWQLKQPLEQLATMVRATYDISDSLSAYARANYAWASVFSQSQYHQTPTLTILATNPYLPAATRTFMQANNIASFDMGRIDTEWLGTTGDNVYWTAQGTAGLRGRVGKFDWDFGYSYGKSVIDSKVYGTREANLAAAEFAVLDANGNVVCGAIASNPNFAANRQTNTITPAKVQPGCVPLNPFGVGNSSQAARDYVAGIEYTRVNMVQQDLALNVTGSVFELPAGEIGLAAGVEYRRDKLSQVADPLQILGVYSSGNNRSYAGRRTVKEGYVEAEVPLLKGIPAVQALGLNVAGRFTDYETSGSVRTWKAGLTWEPMDDLLLRATRSRDIRAPSLSDLYLVGGVSATGSFVNPFNGQSARLPVQTTGNPSLVPEVADTTAFGFTFQGREGVMSGFRLSVDRFQIKVKDVIATVGATDILQRCFQGIQTYCSAIIFDNSAFGIAQVNTRAFNQSLLTTEGFDFEVGYRFGLGGVHLPGTMDLSLFATNTIHIKTTDRPGPEGVTVDNAGVQAGVPKWVASAFLTYRLDPVTVALQARTFSPVRYSALLFGPDQAGYDASLATSINKNTFASRVYLNLNGSVRFSIADHEVTAFANIANITNQTPPEYAIAAINLGGNPYDYVGRTYKLGVRFGF